MMRLFAWITGVPRYRPEIKWSKDSWTHNVFRCKEWLVGRPHRVTPELYFSHDNGKTTFYFVTMESLIAHFEGLIRLAFRKWVPKEIRFPQFVSTQGMTVPSGVFMAVAYDSGGTQTTAATNPTFNFTITGSNIMLIGFAFYNTNADGVTGMTWNTSENLTKDETVHFTTGSQYGYLFHLASASTGTHALTGAAGAANMRIDGASYTGSHTSLDAHTQNTQDNTATITCSITTGAANTIIVAGTINNNGDASTSSDGNVRQHSGTGFSLVDKACASSGSNSVANSGAGFGATVDWAYVIASIKPPPVGPTNVKTWDNVAIASVKTVDDVAIASIKSIDGVT